MAFKALLETHLIILSRDGNPLLCYYGNPLLCYYCLFHRPQRPLLRLALSAVAAQAGVRQLAAVRHGQLAAGGYVAACIQVQDLKVQWE